MTYYSISSLVIATTGLFLGFYVLFKNRRSLLNITFCLFSFSIAIWSFFYFLWLLAPDYDSALFFARAFMFGAILIPVTYFHFITVLLRISDRLKTFVRFAYLICLSILLANFTPFFITGVGSKLGFQFWPNPGILFHPFLFCYFFGLVAYGLFLMIKTIYDPDYSRTFKNQIVYIFWGTFLGFLGGSTNFLLWYNIPIPPFGNIFVVSYVITVAYAIVKHRLMGIETVLQKGAFYTLLTGFIISFYAVLVLIFERLFQGIVGYTSVIGGALIAFIIAILFQPMLRTFQNVTDRIFLRHRYDYQKTLRTLSREISSKIQLEEVAGLIVSTFVQVMKVSEISFLVFDKGRNKYKSVDLSSISTDGRYKKIEVNTNGYLVEHLRSTERILVLEEVEEELARERFDKSKLENILGETKPIGFRLWMPIMLRDQLLGIIAVGEKLSGDIYTVEDMRLLNTLASQTALALDNVRLYQEVLEMKNYNEEVLNSLVYGVLTTDENGIIRSSNPSMCKIIEKQLRDIIGKPYKDIFQGKNPLSISINSTLQDKCFYNFEAGLLSRKKGLIPVMINTTLLGTPSKKTGMLLAVRDLTEIKELENKARQADKLQALGTMSAGMAHEIKNPLSSLRILSQLLPIKYEDPEFRTKLIDIVPQEVSRIDRIVESLLRFARTTKMKFSTVDIKDYLEEILKDYLRQAKEGQVKIVKNYANLPEVTLDKDQLLQVFSNLFVNAIQAMPEGGTMTINTKVGKEMEGLIQGVLVEISDTGHGISEENLKHLFDPFFTTKYGGTGLGLTIAHNIVEAHRGEIKVTSNLGQGTAFHIYLPVQQ